MSKQGSSYQDAGDRRRPGTAEIALVLLLIAIVAIVALMAFGPETQAILSTTSGSV
ncbi:MAG TPA: hypothetical protein VM451_05140 [Candidatus Limnocylindria bacterium]|nr:hypothetical protein [Candidatus Limnocylindria bacterium]